VDHPGALIADDKHLTVMLHQCDEVLQRVRKRAMRVGTSLTLTFKLERLRQHLERIHELIALLGELRTRRVVEDAAPRIVRLFKTLVRAECRKNILADYWGQNVELLSLRMTESASKTGEHYITSSRSEYFGLFASAALGGLIIAFMAANKIVLGSQGMAPLNELLSFCLNYGLGFMLIHMLGGTVATKQPAMTANAIAASIGEAKGKTRDLEALADLIVRTIRSQIGAILGNIGVAIPVAIGVGVLIHLGTGSHFISPEKAHTLLDEIHPLGGALFFAAIAGVCLFMSGLIAAYYDNLSAYNRIPQRLTQLRGLRRLLGERRLHTLAGYVEQNIGRAGRQLLLRLPARRRHRPGCAVRAADRHPPHRLLVGLPRLRRGGARLLDPADHAAIAFAGVLLIGLTNLAVSFALTLSVAMRARRITFAQSRSLGGLLLRRLLRAPHAFLFPPRADEAGAWSDAAERLECASPSPRHSSMDRTGAS
jgi:site-specific recombinase